MIYLEVACNDPDNGIFCGRTSMLQIGGAEFEARARFEANTLAHCGYAFSELPSAVRLAGKSWKIAGSKEWFGNWCWNRYDLYHPKKTTRWYFVDFLTWLRDRRLFYCTVAPEPFLEWFNGNADVSPDDIHRMVCDLERHDRMAS